MKLVGQKYAQCLMVSITHPYNSMSVEIEEGKDGG